jgi:hypothetical protein
LLLLLLLLPSIMICFPWGNLKLVKVTCLLHFRTCLLAAGGGSTVPKFVRAALLSFVFEHCCRYGLPLALSDGRYISLSSLYNFLRCRLHYQCVPDAVRVAQNSLSGKPRPAYTEVTVPNDFDVPPSAHHPGPLSHGPSLAGCVSLFAPLQPQHPGGGAWASSWSTHTQWRR